jgi:hypothetical protein
LFGKNTKNKKINILGKSTWRVAKHALINKKKGLKKYLNAVFDKHVLRTKIVFFFFAKISFSQT